ncbi:MAG: Nickel uptake substrate-specific transmembrane region [Methanosaeta sp. PtaU1.Bin060]|nr:MAG: Nickel uptake substrate-specific transmembrane region [Methanosaeta sp. PtaU1.Bin060]
MRRELLIIAFVMLISLASCHSLYAEFPQKLSANSQAKIWIAYGHGGSAESDLESLQKADLITPSGDASAIQLEPYKSGLLGSISLSEKGCYLLDLQAETALFDPTWYGSSGYRSLIEKYAHVLIPVESGNGYSWSDGEGLEIVPKTDPYGLKSGEKFSATAMWNGKPIAGSFSATIARLPDDVLVIQHSQQTEAEGTCSDGSMSFEIDKPGLWVVSFDATIDEPGSWTASSDDPKGHYKKGDKLQYDSIAPTAFLTFWAGL